MVLTVLVILSAGIAVYKLFLRNRQPTEVSVPPLVRTIEIRPVSELETKAYPGIAKEAQIAKLSFRVPGKLLDSNIVIGARFEKDAVIAKLDPRDYELSVKRFEAELTANEALYEAMKTGARPEDLSSVESQLVAATSAYETAETNLKRFTALLADQVASQAQFDAVKTVYDTAKGQKETLENELQKAKTGARKEEIAAMEAKILGVKSALNTARNALDDTLLKAPFDGMIVEKFIEDYEVVAPGIPIISYVNIAQIDVAVSLPEEVIIRMDDIRNYHVEFEAYPGRKFPARLKEIGLAVQRGRQTFPLQVRIDLPKEETTKHPSVFPGMAATVAIDFVRKKNGEKLQNIPLAALVGLNGESGVFVIETDSNKTCRVRRRAVKLIRTDSADAEVESDLKPGDHIVSAGARFLTEGQLVRLEQ